MDLTVRMRPRLATVLDYGEEKIYFPFISSEPKQAWHLNRILPAVLMQCRC